MNRIPLAIIGCGAVAEKYHLPAIVECERVVPILLVDKNLERASMLAERFSVPDLAEDYHEVVDRAEAAIVALPHYLHAPVSVDLLSQGIHVLVEKPMALTGDECDEMIRAANEADAVLAVGHMRRFYPASQLVKQWLQDELLGNVLSFDFREGGVYGWPVASDFFFRKETAGGGVLADRGAHTLDMLLWWLGDYDSFEYYDDAMGGVEANCELHLQMRSGATGTVELSRTRGLRNSYILHGERGTLEVGTGFDPTLRMTTARGDVFFEGKAMWTESPQESALFTNVMRHQLEDFTHAIRDHREPFVSGREGSRAVKLIEACYTTRQPLNLPWMLPCTASGVQGEVHDR